MRKTDQGCMQRGPSRVWPQRSCPEQRDSRERRKKKWAIHRKARVGQLGEGEVCEWLSQGLSTNTWEQDGNYLEQKKSWEGLHKFTTIPASIRTHTNVSFIFTAFKTTAEFSHKGAPVTAV